MNTTKTKAGRPMLLPKPVLTRIILMRHRHGMNNSEIARALDADGVETSTGQGPWSRTTIWHLFNTTAVRNLEAELEQTSVI